MKESRIQGVPRNLDKLYPSNDSRLKRDKCRGRREIEFRRVILQETVIHLRPMIFFKILDGFKACGTPCMIQEEGKKQREKKILEKE